MPISKKHTHVKNSFILVCALGLSLLTISQSAQADPVEDFWRDTTFNGDIRSYYFTRDYTNPKTIDQSAYSLGGNLRVLTGKFLGGFQIGAALYTAQPLGLNSDNPKQVDKTLPGDSVTALGQAYLQYQRSDFLIRAGDQLINTPWLNAADSRMIPATYRGFYGTWTPKPEWTLTALRIYEFKSRVADDFSATNAYNPQNLGYNTPGVGDTTTSGAQALGAMYKASSFTAQAWGYEFFQYARLLYTDFEYLYKNKTSVSPLIGMQFLTEGGDGSNILAQVSTGAANSTAYGAVIGAEIPRGRITFGYNRIIPVTGAFNNGDVVSPYTFTSDPLYTTSMIAGLVDKTAGEAIKIAATLNFFEQRVKFTTSFAQYYTQPLFSNTDETDFDLTYSFKNSKHKYLSGLSLRNRLGIMSGDPAKGTFYYNRVMLQYSF